MVCGHDPSINIPFIDGNISLEIPLISTSIPSTSFPLRGQNVPRNILSLGEINSYPYRAGKILGSSSYLKIGNVLFPEFLLEAFLFLAM
jgi:hypothetical protein